MVREGYIALFLTWPLCITLAGAQQSASTGTHAPVRPLEERTIYDSSYHRLRRVWVYTPPSYDARRTMAYPLIVAFDGAEYRDTMPLPFVLDTLLAARRAPAFVAVLVDDSVGPTRIADLGNASRMVQFLERQLLPFLRRGWHVTTDPHRVIVTG